MTAQYYVLNQCIHKYRPAALAALSYWVPFVLACWCASPLHAADVFPYQATIQTEKAYVHAGPGEDFYPTSELKQGQVVEVYRHDADQWCAIRPLDHSYSWIAAEHLEITDNPKLARVINVPVKTRVGSLISNAFDVEYISLRQGEIVELVGSAVKNQSPDAVPARWFKVAPPAGEFRYVHLSHLRKTTSKGADPVETRQDKLEPMEIPTYSLDDGTQQPASIVSEAVSEVAASVIPVASKNFVDAQDVPSGIANQTVRQVAFEESTDQRLDASPNATESESETPILATQDSAAIQTIANPRSSNTHVNVVTWEAIGEPHDPLHAPEPRSFVDTYNALNIMLSRAILGDIEDWKLDKLQRQVTRLTEVAKSVDQQKLAEGLAVRISEFKALQDRKSAIASDRTPAPLKHVESAQPLPLPNLNNQYASADYTEDVDSQKSDRIEMPRKVPLARKEPIDVGRLMTPKDAIDNSVFDATGVLIVVKTRRSDIPKYALTNRSGEIVKFVSANNGTNLAHLVNKEVGVLGTNGFIRKLNRPHVVADRVFVLQR